MAGGNTSRAAGTAAALACLLAAAACSSGTGDPCSGVSCSSRGFCVADLGTAYCACIGGYHPVRLACLANDAAEPCRDVDCSGHGTCRVEAGGPSCDCDDGFRYLDSPDCSSVECDLVCVPGTTGDGGGDGEDRVEIADGDGSDDTTCVPAGAELCDRLDNDCDGLTDEDFDLDFDRAHCGSCGALCADGAHGAGVCVLGDCEMICEPGWSNLDGDPLNGCEATCVPGPAPAENVCDGRDDDCDGATDEEWLTADTCGFGLCRRSAICHRGTIACRPRMPPAASDATCDGIDDDCDGATDEECPGPDADADADGDADADADADADVPPVPVCGNGSVESPEECDDGNLAPLDGCEPDCTFSCHGAGECDDGDPCTADDCVADGAGRRCVHPIAAGTPCDDGNDCTTGETCSATGACTGGTSTCMCVSDPDCAPHEDGDLCNGTLVCRLNACVVDAATVVTCPTGADDECRRNTCAPATGVCSLLPINEGLPCNDGLFCTVTDRCSAGTCVGSGAPCVSGGCVGGCDEGGDTCSPAGAGTPCRAAAGICDGAEACDGTLTACPADAFRPSSYPCRSSAGQCDAAENCAGFSADCPTDVFWPASIYCNDGLRCTYPDNCDGAGGCRGTPVVPRTYPTPFAHPEGTMLGGVPANGICVAFVEYCSESGVPTAVAGPAGWVNASSSPVGCDVNECGRPDPLNCWRYFCRDMLGDVGNCTL